MEAAVLLPALLTVLALLLQPACLLYTRSIMSSAAAESARMAATASSADEVAAYAKRRLAAVPEVGTFHVGGEEDWQIEVSGVGAATSGGGTVCVQVTGHARPLPIMGSVSAALGGSDGEGVVLRVREEVDSRADWVSGGYSEWASIW